MDADPQTETMHACLCPCVTGSPPPEEAGCHKDSLALARGAAARAEGMKLKLTTQERSREVSEEHGNGGAGEEAGGGGETKNNKDAEADRKQ